MFQETELLSGHSIFNQVDIFSDQGHIFDDGSSMPRTEKEIALWGALMVNIREDRIFNRSGWEDYKKNYLFRFPLRSVFCFLCDLYCHFEHEGENNAILKWPDSIEKKLNEYGLGHSDETNDEEPNLLDIEKKNGDLFNRWGRPKIRLYTGGGWRRFKMRDWRRNGYFQYSLKIEFFRPGYNRRINDFRMDGGFNEEDFEGEGDGGLKTK